MQMIPIDRHAANPRPLGSSRSHGGRVDQSDNYFARNTAAAESSLYVVNEATTGNNRTCRVEFV
ncbi:MAG: hypothetical protein JWN70_305 [Planctomycetaceae bacterium]|nr:hypothetical protein [Planctomycetaceae bacterium]